jgi:thioredoxin 1
MSENLKKITEDNFLETIKKGVTLVDFYADWCGPCRMMVPSLEQVAGDFKGEVNVVKLDVDAAQRIASEYQVSSIPTLILFKDGKEMDRVVGVQNADALKKFISKSK